MKVKCAERAERQRIRKDNMRRRVTMVKKRDEDAGEQKGSMLIGFF